MTSFIVPADAGEDSALDNALLPLAAAAYLARFKGVSREHTDSDLRALLSWCACRKVEMVGPDVAGPRGSLTGIPAGLEGPVWVSPRGCRWGVS